MDGISKILDEGWSSTLKIGQLVMKTPSLQKIAMNFAPEGYSRQKKNPTPPFPDGWYAGNTSIRELRTLKIRVGGGETEQCYFFNGSNFPLD